MALQRRRLEDLFKVGEELTISQTLPDGTEVGDTVWIQKLGPVDHKQAMRRATAARAVLLAAREDESSELYRQAWANVLEFASPDMMRMMIIRDDLAMKRLAIEAEVSMEDAWHTDNYLQGLYDAWTNGLAEAFTRDAEDPEAKRVFEELKRFDEQVDAQVEGHEESLKRDLEHLDEVELRRQAARKFLERDASQAFAEEYQACEIWLTTRKAEKHEDYYFENRKKVDDLDDEVKAQIIAKLREISIDVIEGKSLEDRPSSSPSSEQLETSAMGDSSGPPAATE